MHIILEGADSSGKSTLAKRLARDFRLLIKISEGPPASQEEYEQRVVRYLGLPPFTICDRHPIISETIYSSVIPERVGCIAPPHHVNLFFDQCPLIIYCRRMNNTLAPQDGPSDTPEHVEQVARHHDDIREEYDDYFEATPHVRYTSTKEYPRIHAVVHNFMEIKLLSLYNLKVGG